MTFKVTVNIDKLVLEGFNQYEIQDFKKILEDELSKIVSINEIQKSYTFGNYNINLTRPIFLQYKGEVGYERLQSVGIELAKSIYQNLINENT